jgi:hypothetical protein
MFDVFAQVRYFLRRAIMRSYGSHRSPDYIFTPVGCFPFRLT